VSELCQKPAQVVATDRIIFCTNFEGHDDDHRSGLMIRRQSDRTKLWLEEYARITWRNAP
jgi:hypothetical protein